MAATQVKDDLYGERSAGETGVAAAQKLSGRSSSGKVRYLAGDALDFEQKAADMIGLTRPLSAGRNCGICHATCLDLHTPSSADDHSRLKKSLTAAPQHGASRSPDFYCLLRREAKRTGGMITENEKIIFNLD